jgi:hypothetical protein
MANYKSGDKSLKQVYFTHPIMNDLRIGWHEVTLSGDATDAFNVPNLHNFTSPRSIAALSKGETIQLIGRGITDGQPAITVGDNGSGARGGEGTLITVTRPATMVAGESVTVVTLHKGGNFVDGAATPLFNQDSG